MPTVVPNYLKRIFSSGKNMYFSVFCSLNDTLFDVLFLCEQMHISTCHFWFEGLNNYEHGNGNT